MKELFFRKSQSVSADMSWMSWMENLVDAIWAIASIYLVVSLTVGFSLMIGWTIAEAFTDAD